MSPRDTADAEWPLSEGMQVSALPPVWIAMIISCWSVKLLKLPSVTLYGLYMFFMKFPFLSGINNAKQMTLDLTKLLIVANNEQSNLSYQTQRRKNERRPRRRIKNANSFSRLTQIREKAKIRRSLNKTCMKFLLLYNDLNYRVLPWVMWPAKRIRPKNINQSNKDILTS